MKVEVIRTSGVRENHTIEARGGQARIRAIEKLIDTDCTDTVNLRDGRVMIVIDRGWETEETHDGGCIQLKPTRPLYPINVEATKLYHTVCRPNTTHQIAGDVVIAYDADFA